MSRRAGVAMLLALAIVLTPTAAVATEAPPGVSVPAPNATIPFIEQPIEAGGEGVDSALIDVRADPAGPDLCSTTVSLTGSTWSWSCTLPWLSPGAQTINVVQSLVVSDPSDPTVVNFTVGPSALAITSKKLTRRTMTIKGTRDAGPRFQVRAEFDPSEPTESSSFHTLAVTEVGCDNGAPSGNQFTCTYSFGSDLAVGRTIDVTVNEQVSGSTVSQRSTSLTVSGPADDGGTEHPSTPHDPTGPGSPAPNGVPPVQPSPRPTATTSPTSEPDTSALPEPTETAPTSKTPTVAVAPTPDIDVLRLLLLMVIAFAILAMIGPHGLAFASDPGRRQLERPPAGPDDASGPFGSPQHADGSTPDAMAGAGASLTLAALAARAKREGPDKGSGDGRRYGISWGDRSPSWQFPGWKWIDKLSLHGPVATAPRLPLVARIGADATYLRAAFGSLWVLFPAIGLALGIFAANSTHGLPVAPSTAITTTLLVLALLDATSGAVAVIGFTAVVLARGGLTADGLSLADGLRGLLGLAALWFAIPLVAAAARPFRRLAQPRRVYGWDRLGDAAIASLVGGWAVLGVARGFSDLLGRPVAVSHHAGALALLTIGVIIARMVLEEVVANGYPARLRAVQHLAPFPEPTAMHQLRGILVRAALMALFASAVISNCWQLWVGVSLYVVPQLATLVEDELPNSVALHRRLPRGIVEILLMLVVGAVLARMIDSTYSHEPSRALRDGFLLLALPGFVLTTLGILGRASPAPPWTWPRQLAGAAIVVITVVLALVLL